MPGAGVDVDSIVANVGIRIRRVPVPWSRWGLKEIVANPEKVDDVLPIERNHRTNTGMDEQVIAAADPWHEAFQEERVCTRESLEGLAMEIASRCRVRRRMHAIGGQRRRASKL